jgi:hypothetical protein
LSDQDWVEIALYECEVRAFERWGIEIIQLDFCSPFCTTEIPVWSKNLERDFIEDKYLACVIGEFGEEAVVSSLKPYIKQVELLYRLGKYKELEDLLNRILWERE